MLRAIEYYSVILSVITGRKKFFGKSFGLHYRVLLDKTQCQMRRQSREVGAAGRNGIAETDLARLSATIDPKVLATAKLFADATGFRHSFSAYLNEVIDRDNKRQAELLKTRVLASQTT